jgi:hypothetical protein
MLTAVNIKSCLMSERMINIVNTLKSYMTYYLLGVLDTGLRLMSGFRSDVDEICALLGHYAGNCLPTFRDNVSVNNYHTTPRNIPEERRSQG